MARRTNPRGQRRQWSAQQETPAAGCGRWPWIGLTAGDGLDGLSFLVEARLGKTMIEIREASQGLGREPEAQILLRLAQQRQLGIQ
jgi:hypothetical protein